MRTSLRIFFGVVILVILFFILREVNFLEVYNIIEKNPRFFVLAFFSFSLAIVILNLRSMIFLREAIREHDFWFFLSTTLAGNFISAITPPPASNVGGEPVRAYYLGQKYQKSKTGIFGVVLAEKIIHGAVLIFFILASLLFILTYIPVPSWLKIILQALLLFVLVLIIMVFLLNSKRGKLNIKGFLKRFGLLAPVKSKIKIRHISEHFGNFMISLKKTLYDKKTLFFGILFSFAFWILSFLSSYFIFLALGLDVSFFVVIIVISIVNLVGSLSPSPGGAGVIEGSMIFLYSVLGISVPIAVAASLLSRLIIYFHFLVLGGISLVHLEKTLG